MIRAGRGDAEAFRQLYVAMRETVRAFLSSRDGCLTCHDIDDMTQEVFLRAWAGLGEFAARSSVRTFLLGIAKNVLQETWRNRAKVSIRLATCSFQPEDPNQEPLGENEKALSRRVIARAKTEMTAEQRSAFELVYVQGLSVEEASRRCHCNLQQFRNRLWRARMKLREALLDSQDAVLP